MAVSVNFDGSAKIASLAAGTTDATVADIYSAWKRWVLVADNSKFVPMFRVVGGDPISDVISLGVTFFLLNSWKIRPYEGNHRLVITGNLYADDLSSPFAATIGSYNVSVQMQVSSLTQINEVATSGNTYSLSEIRDTVWQAPVNGMADPATVGGWLTKKLLTLRQYVGLS